MNAPLPEIPPLQSGDRLKADEFELRYHAMPGHIKAELINGVVYVMPSPVSNEHHGSPQIYLAGWLMHYQAFTFGTNGGDNSTIRLGDESQPQPDLMLRIRPEAGGQTQTDERGYIEGAPELAAEIAASSASYDLHDKLEVYRNHGVREYIVWRVYDRALDWFIVRGDAYQALLPEDGIHKSETFPGLWLDASALLEENLAGVLQVLQEGIAEQAHQDFVNQLQQRMGS